MIGEDDPLEASARAVAALELRVARAERAAAFSEQEAQAARRQAQRLTEQLEEALEREKALQHEVTDLKETYAEQLSAATQLDASELSERVAELERRHQRSLNEHRARARELEQTVSALAVGLNTTKTDVERAMASRAWRYGHRLMRTMNRLTFRRTRTDGALAAAIEHIEQVQRVTRALPPGTIEGRVSGEDSPGPLGLPGPSRALAPAPLPSPERRADLEAQRARLGRTVRERLGPVPARESWPAISIVVLNRNGHGHLEMLLDGLTRSTDYPAFELVVVDNASDDGSLQLLRHAEVPFELRVIANDENVSFSAGNNQGVESARHDHLLFLNNDVEAFEPGWLKELVATLDGDGVVAAGATLLHVEERHAEPTLQHRAIKLRFDHGTVRGYNAGDGERLLDERFGEDDRAPAVTAACLLLRRRDFDSVGGFSDGYRYGTEDVDLGLKLTAAGGTIVGSGRAIAFHRESATQTSEGRAFMQANRLFNRRLLLERWGPQLRREYRLARLAENAEWTDGRGPHVAITVTSLRAADGWGDWYTAHELGDALEDLGWRVTYVERRGDHWYDLPHDLDHLISLMDVYDLRRVPDHVLVSVWIRNWTDRWLEREWFDRADVILASSRGTTERVESRTGRRTVPFPIATNPDRFRPSANGGPSPDYVFTGNYWGKERAIESALEPLDGETLHIYGKDWDQVDGLKDHHLGVADYDELAGIYSSAKLVLDDTQGPTLPYGAVNCRVFDALASGTLVVTNCRAGVYELFDEDFPVWEDRESLRARLDELLSDDARRQALAERYRGQVLERHTYAHRARQFVDVVREAEERLSFCVKIGANDWSIAERWGDTHFARALGAALRREGHRFRIQTLDEWESEDGLTDDVVIHLRGLSRYHPKPGQFNILWVISHPAEVSGAECDGYDLVLVASPGFADELRERTSTPVEVLEQATDPTVFFPDPDPGLAHDLVYVANSRNVLRPVVRDLLPTHHDLAIWGSRWEGLIDTSLVVAEHIPNSELRKVYSSAAIVLNDHWDDMREHGFVSNRIYDALACGAVVLTDDVAGLERFGDAVVTYSSAEEMRARVDELLADPEALKARGAKGRDVILEAHTFDGRAGALLDAVSCFTTAAGRVGRVVPQQQ